MIFKYLKLRTIHILQNKYLHTWTCDSVKCINFGMKKWYCQQVKDYAKSKNLRTKVPFNEIAGFNKTYPVKERKIFLDWLEQEVIAGRK